MRSPARDAGSTLVELLVVLVLFGVVGSVVMPAIVTAMRSARVSSERTHALHEIEMALQRVGRELRVADPLYLTSGTDYGNEIGAEIVTDGTVQVIRFAVEPGDDGVDTLVQDVTTFDLAAFAEGTATPLELPQRRLVTSIDNGGDPVFTYLDAEDEVISCVPGEGGETKETCDNVYGSAQQIRIRVVRALDNNSSIEAETRINVRNTRYGGVGA